MGSPHVRRAVFTVHGFSDPYDKDGPPGLGLLRGVRACARWSGDTVYNFVWSSGLPTLDMVDHLLRGHPGFRALGFLGKPILGEDFTTLRVRRRAYNVAVRRAQRHEASHFRSKLQATVRDGYGVVDIVAHSLGAHVVRSGLKRADAATLRAVGNVYVLGGAIQSFRTWWPIATGISGAIYNFSSIHDDVLKAYHKWYVKGVGRPIGLPSETSIVEGKRGIDTRLRNVHNLDVSATKVGHFYGRFIPELIDGLAPSVPPRTCPLRKDWRDEFYWDPAPVTVPLNTHRRSRGALVEVVQRALSTLDPGAPGHLPTSAIDGIFGSSTMRALKAFQKSEGLRASGSVGRDTWARLANVPVTLG